MTKTAAVPEPARSYLAAPCLAPVWVAVRTKLEKGALAPTGAVSVDLDTDAAERISGLLGAGSKPLRPGRRRLDLAALDAALRGSAAQAGLVAVVADLTGSTLVDRAVVRAHDRQVRTDLFGTLDAALAGAGCAAAPWVPTFCDGVRRAGVLSKAGDEAWDAVGAFGRVLGELVAAGALPTHFDLAGRPAADDPHGVNGGGVAGVALMLGELGELATRGTGDAHGLDGGRVTAALVLRAAAAAFGVPVPTSATERREVWARLGVSPDAVSGTVLSWGLRPPGDDAWSAMMRQRADLGLVTHLTVQELEAAGVLGEHEQIAVTPPGTVVWACENPQVLQAAARAMVPGPLLCTAGNPASAGWRLLDRLCRAGVVVRYHGDFDWPGVAIAGRLIGLDVEPWRMGAGDYDEAVVAAPGRSRVALTGREAATPWAPELAARMRTVGVAVHEEALISFLLADLADAAAGLSD
ncbi:DUF2399 domain-containing protein [Nocardioides sp. T5]|uniref:DUF2399 domain-containing protein n=1 Tax=Nocardioides sp. T5 TaxID=3400182 RepID=UPI003A8988ED